MEEEKMNPEKPSSVASKDEEGSIPASALPKVVAEPKSTDSPKVELKKNEIDAAEIKEEKSEHKVDKVEGSEEIQEIKKVEDTPPPEIHYTLETVSDEIDKLLSTLSAKIDDENNNVSVEIPEFIVGKFLDIFEETIAKHDSTNDGKLKWCQVSEDDMLFLKCVDRVSKLAKSLSELKSDSDKNRGVLINRVGAIKQRAMSYLEEELRSILELAPHSHSDPKTDTKDAKGKNEADHRGTPSAESEPADGYTKFAGYSPETLYNLSKIAREMISGGYESECIEVYMISRRNAFDESLNQLGFEKISIDDVQKMPWETLEREIAAWISTFTECTAVYFPSERQLAEAVFTDYPMVSSSLFSNLTRGVMIQLLNFAEALAMTKRSEEKLFKTIDMYETLRDNIPALDALYPDQCANEIKAETSTAKIRLGEAAICMFCDLENSIKSDTGKTTVPGGDVHPLTRYTMNYLKYACEYKNTLEQVFREHWKIERSDSTITDFDAGQAQDYNDRNENEHQPSPYSNQLVRVMDLLDSNLEAKSRLYKDVSLSSIFMMNNGRYILQKIKGSAGIHEAMGDTWCRKKSSDLRNYHKNYQRETWSRLLGCLGLEGLMVNGKVMKQVLKERFKSFNAMFDDIHRTQSSWVVSDNQLQSELRVSISAVVIPAYRSFVGRFSQYLDPGRQTEKYIKFQPEDIETYIEELFDGKRKP